MTATANLSARNNESVPVGVNVGNAQQPSANQVLTATSPVTATWQFLPAASTAATGTVQLDGNASDIQPVGVQAAGSVGKAADSGHVHYPYLCTPSVYAPTAQTSFTVNSTVMAAFSSTNLNTGAFVAPTSGNVIVTASFVGKGNSGQWIALGLAPHGTVTPIAGPEINVELPTGDAYPGCPLQFYVSGLTAGTSYNLDLLGCTSTVGTYIIYAIGNTATAPNLTGSAQGSPVIMTVQAI